jgi:hypothetical protein
MIVDVGSLALYTRYPIYNLFSTKQQKCPNLYLKKLFIFSVEIVTRQRKQ